VTADSIERETIVDAPVERVWAILTEAEHIRAWFAFDGADIDLRPGGALRFRWREHGEYHGVVETVEPGRRFGFRWALVPDAQPAEGNSTRVEFTLEPAGDGTRLRVHERGFRSLAADRDKHLSDNTDGWRGALDGLKGHAERVAA
jgi:uncharacterized protein YndB with AHSA1/START domain